MYAGVPFLDVEDISDMVYWLGTSRAAGKFNGRDVALDTGTLQVLSTSFPVNHVLYAE